MGYWEGKDIPIKGVTQKVHFYGPIELVCSTCGHEVEIICNTKIHKLSRSTRCCNEEVWQRKNKRIEFQKQFVEARELPKAIKLKGTSMSELKRIASKRYRVLGISEEQEAKHNHSNTPPETLYETNSFFLANLVSLWKGFFGKWSDNGGPWVQYIRKYEDKAGDKG